MGLFEIISKWRLYRISISRRFHHQVKLCTVVSSLVLGLMRWTSGGESWTHNVSVIERVSWLLSKVCSFDSKRLQPLTLCLQGSGNTKTQNLRSYLLCSNCRAKGLPKKNINVHPCTSCKEMLGGKRFDICQLLKFRGKEQTKLECKICIDRIATRLKHFCRGIHCVVPLHTVQSRPVVVSTSLASSLRDSTF